MVAGLAGAQPLDGTIRPVVDGEIATYAPGSGMSGAIVVAGSDTMQPLVARLASEFRRWQPDIKIAIQGGGTDAALLQFVEDQATIRRGDANPRGHLVSGSVAILASSRSLTLEEIRKFHSRYGYDPVEIPIALDAVAIYVNASNPIEGLTLDQLDAIFSRDRKRGAAKDIITWGQLGVAGWDEQPIRLYGRDKQSGTRTFFKHEALLDGELRSDVREQPGSASEILAISRDALGIGYAGIGFLASTVRVVPLAEKAGMPFVTPSAEAARDGRYPLSRHLYLYAKRDPKSDMKAAILEFLRFVNSREGQQVVAKAGVYPLSAAQVGKNLMALNGPNLAKLTVAAEVR
jgi:phosphate transport system substrate-binding protein